MLALISRKPPHLHRERCVTRTEAGRRLDEREAGARRIVRIRPGGDAAAGVNQT
ncbi:MAG TPA: hypothetical protein VF710_05385 [Longimicrobium sp.]